MNTPAIGHNNPPTPMEVCASNHDDILSEAANWADGETVETEEQLTALDVVIKGMKGYRSELKGAVEEYRRPFMDANTAALNAAKAYTEDADRIQKALVEVGAPFREKLEAEKKAATDAAWKAAREAERKAEEIAAKANPANIEDARAADAAKQAAIEADNAARTATKDKVKGLRKATKHEIVSMRDLVNWIATNDKDAMAEFATAYADKNRKNIPDAIVRTWEEKEAF